MSVLLRKTISFPEEVGTRFGEEARIDSCHFSPDRISFCLLRHLLNRAWNVSSFCGEDGERCRQKKSVCRPSTMKLLEQPEQSIKWIYALEPSVIQSVYHMKFWSYSSLVLLFSGSFISPAACSQLRQTEGCWFLSIRRVFWMVMIIFSTSWSVSSFSVCLRLQRHFYLACEDLWMRSVISHIRKWRAKHNTCRRSTVVQYSVLVSSHRSVVAGWPRLSRKGESVRQWNGKL